MVKTIGIGKQDFASVIEDNCFFVDKTSFIKEWWDSKDDVTLITRPRRFGKTLNMSMLNCFFSNQYKDRSDLFDSLSIWEDEDYRKIQGTYPVIFMSFASVKADNLGDAKIQIKAQIEAVYKRHRYLLEGDTLTADEIADFEGTNTRMGDAESGLKLNILCEYFHRYWGKKTIIILDEYDTPIQEAYLHGYWNEFTAYIRSLFNATFKTNPYMERAIMTGITRVSKESIFSDLNNLNVITTTSSSYATSFGFTENEVFDAMEEYGLSGEKDTVKKWYDGFKFGNHSDIYNPWSILNYARRKVLVPYWVNTSANTMLKQAIEKADYDFKKQYEKLIKNNYLETRVVLQTSFYEVANTPNLWGMFVSAGYLTVTKSIDALNDQYRVEIPNKEIRKEFINLTEYYLALQTGQLNDVVYNLLQEDRDEFFDSYQNILMLPSYHDLNDENSYHMMMLGMCICLSNNYKVISNREEGKGRCDIIIQAKDEKKTSFIIEFKYFKEDKKDFEKALDKLSNEAIQQIKDRRYDYDLKGKVIYIGLAHHGKDVMMKWEEKVYI